jgi:transcriptional regulator with XRE-family HTH domain
MQLILNPHESISARNSLDISQSAVSRDTGINRVYISQFESGKRILEDSQLNALRDNYIELGWIPPEPNSESQPKTKSYPVKIRDGVVVLNYYSDEKIEEILSEIYAIKSDLQNSEQQEIPRGYFGNIDQDKALRRCIWILLHYMKLYQLQESLQGKKAKNKSEIEISQVETNADYVQIIMRNYGLGLR